MADVARQVAIFQGLRERIATAYDLDRDDEAVMTSAVGECDVEGAILSALREAREAGAYADALSGMIDAQRARQARLKAKADALRKAAAWAMAEIGQPKIIAPDLTASLGRGNAELILDEGATFAPPFARQDPKWITDRTAIREHLEAGHSLEGARLGNAAPILTVRTK